MSKGSKATRPAGSSARRAAAAVETEKTKRFDHVLTLVRHVPVETPSVFGHFELVPGQDLYVLVETLCDVRFGDRPQLAHGPNGEAIRPCRLAVVDMSSVEIELTLGSRKYTVHVVGGRAGLDGRAKAAKNAIAHSLASPPPNPDDTVWVSSVHKVFWTISQRAATQLLTALAQPAYQPAA